MWDTIWHVLVLLLLVRAGSPRIVVGVSKGEPPTTWAPPEAPR